jgi:hypothetical protein
MSPRQKSTVIGWGRQRANVWLMTGFGGEMLTLKGEGSRSDRPTRHSKVLKCARSRLYETVRMCFAHLYQYCFRKFKVLLLLKSDSRVQTFLLPVVLKIRA